jgi:hypothetical protein
VVNVVGEMVFPTPPGGQWTPSGFLAIATQQHDRLVVASYLEMGWGFLFIPAFFALLHVIRGRGVLLAHIGVTFALIGACLSGLVLGGFYLIVAVIGSPGLDATVMTALLQKVTTDPSVAPILLGFTMASVGLFPIGLAVWRSGLTYSWVGPLISLLAVAEYIPIHNDVIDTALRLLTAVGPVVIGYRILTMSDTEWGSGPVPAVRQITALVS